MQARRANRRYRRVLVRDAREPHVIREQIRDDRRRAAIVVGRVRARGGKGARRSSSDSKTYTVLRAAPAPVAVLTTRASVESYTYVKSTCGAFPQGGARRLELRHRELPAPRADQAADLVPAVREARRALRFRGQTRPPRATLRRVRFPAASYRVVSCPARWRGSPPRSSPSRAGRAPPRRCRSRPASGRKIRPRRRRCARCCRASRTRSLVERAFRKRDVRRGVAEPRIGGHPVVFGFERRRPEVVARRIFVVDARQPIRVVVLELARDGLGARRPFGGVRQSRISVGLLTRS